MTNNFLLFILILIILLLICIVRFDQKKNENFVSDAVDCKRYEFLCTDKVEKWQYVPYFREQTIGIYDVDRTRRYR